MIVVGSIALVATVVVSACDADGNPVACTAQATAGIAVSVQDSASGTLVGRGARIIAQDGTFADTARATTAHDGPYALAFERGGTYTVTVEQQGFRTWSRSGVSVTRDQCHVRTAALTARLQPWHRRSAFVLGPRALGSFGFGVGTHEHEGADSTRSAIALEREASALQWRHGPPTTGVDVEVPPGAGTGPHVVGCFD